MRKTEGKRRISNCAERYLKNECLQIFADMADMFRWIIHFWGSRPIPGAWTATRRFITASSVAIRSWTKRMMWMDPRERSISIVFQQAMVEIQNFLKYVKANMKGYVTNVGMWQWQQPKKDVEKIDQLTKKFYEFLKKNHSFHNSFESLWVSSHHNGPVTRIQQELFESLEDVLKRHIPTTAHAGLNGQA